MFKVALQGAGDGSSSWGASYRVQWRIGLLTKVASAALSVCTVVDPACSCGSCPLVPLSRLPDTCFFKGPELLR